MSNEFIINHTPCHVFDLDQLNQNISILKRLEEETNSKVLYAIKGCSQQEVLPNIAQKLSGACASGYNEALLAYKLQFSEIHTFSAAYKREEIPIIAEKSNVVIFNSAAQYTKYAKTVEGAGAISGLRINPNYSEIKNCKVNPCSLNSRFGVGISELKELDKFPEYIHFHSMCEQFSDTLERTLIEIEKLYGEFLHNAKTLNIGGGQLFTSPEYDLSHAIHCINKFKTKYNIEIVMEPCEAVLYNVGYLVGSVIDIKYGPKNIAILDLSAICHIPDIVFSNYEYKILGGFASNLKEYKYIVAGPTCYSGDIFGEFSFERPLYVGSKVIICDTAHYTTVKSSMFNGISLPSVAVYSKEKSLQLKRIYGYNDYLSIT